ncbi:MAG TPA: ABC transporter permease [Dehalococcoidia bacterium]|nr:ABC transporter permease [Dehalococcoidia bacterium]
MTTDPHQTGLEAVGVLAPQPASRLAHSGAIFARFSRRQPIGMASAVILLVVALAAIFADLIAPYSPTRNDVGPALVGPNAEHLFGTDQFGRDVFSRVIHGARVSLYVGLGATLIGAAIATVLGATSGYLGGLFDYVLQRFVDAAQAVPPLVLLIGLLVVLGPSVTNVIVALSVRQGLSLSRVVRGAVIGVRASPYIEAAQAIGASNVRTIALHVLPNILPTVIVLISTSIGGIIVAEASLSFLGYGVPPPTPSWGGMMSAEGRTYMIVASWILIFPTVALSLVVFAMNMLGDALRDELDPRLRGG